MKRRKESGGRTAVSVLTWLKPWAWPAWNCEIYAERGRAAVLIRYVRLLGTKNGCQAGHRFKTPAFGAGFLVRLLRLVDRQQLPAQLGKGPVDLHAVRSVHIRNPDGWHGAQIRAAAPVPLGRRHQHRRAGNLLFDLHRGVWSLCGDRRWKYADIHRQGCTTGFTARGRWRHELPCTAN